MYIVEYCDHEGNLQERKLQTLEDAQLEADALKETYDYVRVLDANGNQVIW